MTEAEWLDCIHPAAMLIHLRGEVSDKEKAESRSRLHSGAGELYPGPSPFASPARFTRFIVACAARMRHVPVGELTAKFLETFQSYAEGRATLDALRAHFSEMHAGRVKGQRRAADYLAFLGGETPLEAGHACWNLSGAAAWALAKDSIALTCKDTTEDDWFEWSFSGGPPDPLYQATARAEGCAQAELLREVIGNPFRPTRVDLTWLRWNDGVVVRLARQIYADNTFDQIPLVADALEDAGCSERHILDHLRGASAHVRGCWAVDLILAQDR